MNKYIQYFFVLLLLLAALNSPLKYACTYIHVEIHLFFVSFSFCPYNHIRNRTHLKYVCFDFEYVYIQNDLQTANVLVGHMIFLLMYLYPVIHRNKVLQMNINVQIHWKCIFEQQKRNKNRYRNVVEMAWHWVYRLRWITSAEIILFSQLFQCDQWTSI